MDAVGLLGGLHAEVLHAARAGLHVAHGVEAEVGPRALAVQHAEAAAARLPLEIHDLVVAVHQLQHLRK